MWFPHPERECGVDVDVGRQFGFLCFSLACREKGEPDTPLRDRRPGRGLKSGGSVRAGRGEGRLVAQGFFGVGTSGTAAPLPVRLANEFVQRPASFRIEVDVPAFRLVWRLEKADEFTVLEVSAVDRGPQCHDPRRQKRVSAALKRPAVERAAPGFQDEFGWPGVGLNDVVEAEVQRLVGDVW